MSDSPKSHRSARPREQPQRTCVGCQQVRGKRELIRVVRSPAGEVAVDRTGRAPGRGVYLCPRLECLTAAQRSHRLERSLGVPLSEAVWQQLQEELSRG